MLAFKWVTYFANFVSFSSLPQNSLKFGRLGKKTSIKKEICFTNCEVYVRAALIVHAGLGSTKV